MSNLAPEKRPSLTVYFRDAGIAVWGVFGMVGGLIGHILNLGYVSEVSLWVWVLALVVCLVLAPARAHYKQEARHLKEMRETQEANRALWYYCKLRAMESEVRSVMNRLPTDAGRGADVYENFIREHLTPWIEQLQLFSAGTTWEETELSNSIADNDPNRDYGSIIRYVGD